MSHRLDLLLDPTELLDQGDGQPGQEGRRGHIEATVEQGDRTFEFFYILSYR